MLRGGRVGKRCPWKIISLRGLLERRQLSEAQITVISLDVALALNYLHKSKPPIIQRGIRCA